MSIGTSTSVNALPLGASVSVTFASNGVCALTWWDGTHLNTSYASSPYTSWTTLQIASTSGIVASQRLDTSDTINLIFYVSSGLDYKLLTLSGTTYSQGSADLVASIATGGSNLMGCIMEKDPQNRYWAVLTDRIGSTITAYETTTPGTASWTNNHSVSWSSDIENNYPAGGIVGNYLLFLYPTATSTFVYDRVDVHNSSIGSWTSGTSFTPGGSSVTYDSYMSFRGNSTAGVEANDSGSGIWARVYTPGTDSWASAVQLSTSANDARPTVIAGADGNLYVFWQSYVASNNYAIKYKMYNVTSSTWDSSATTLVASGANNINPVGGSNNNVIGVSYITGTASPYTVNFATITLSSSNPVTVTETNTVTESVTLASTIAFSESVSTTETQSQQTALSITDTALTQSEILNTQSTLSVSETQAITEQQSGQSSLTIAGETLLITEQQSGQSAVVLTEVGTQSETETSQSVLSFSETLTITEQLAYAYPVSFEEDLTVTESFSLASAIAPVEQQIVTESLAIQGPLTLPPETQSLTEQFQLQSAVAPSETLTTIESESSQSVLSLSETNTITEQYSLVYTVISEEDLVVTESFSLATTSIYSEQQTVIEGVQEQIAIVVSETLATIEQESSQSALAFSEALTTLESESTQGTVSVSESWALTEVLNRASSLGLTELQSTLEQVLLAGTLSLIEQQTITEVLPLSFVEIQTLIEQYTLQSALSFTEQLSVTELVTVARPQFFTETLTLTESYQIQSAIVVTESSILYEIVTYPQPFVTSLLTILPTIQAFAGGIILSLIAPPYAPYAVGGVVLDLQPAVQTAPVSTGPAIAYGTTFFLGFYNPTPMILNLFTSGAFLSLSFGLSDRSTRTALVSIQSTQIGAFLLVNCTLLEDSAPYNWVLPVQCA